MDPWAQWPPPCLPEGAWDWILDAGENWGLKQVNFAWPSKLREFSISYFFNLFVLRPTESTCYPYCQSQTYHAKHLQAYGNFDPVDILPATCTGLCLAACLVMAFTVLQWLQPTPPDRPIIIEGSGGQRSLNNACGWVLPYAKLRNLTPAQVEQLSSSSSGDGLADHVSRAEASASFLAAAWDKIRAQGKAAEATKIWGHPWHWQSSITITSR